MITSHLVTLLAGVEFELLENASVGKRVKWAEKGEFVGGQGCRESYYFLKRNVYHC